MAVSANDTAAISGGIRSTSVPYLLAHFGKSQMWHASTLLFAFFLTERCGLAPGTMGLILGGTLLLNGVADLCFGVWYRRRLTNARIAVYWQARGALAACLFFAGFCATPLLYPTYRSGWALATLLGFRLTFASLDVAQNTVAALIGRTPADVRQLAAWRGTVTALAVLAVSGVAAPLVLSSNAESPLGIVWWAIFVGMCAIGGTAALAMTAPTLPAPAWKPDTSSSAPTPYPAILGLLVLFGVGITLFRELQTYLVGLRILVAPPMLGLLVWIALGNLAGQHGCAALRRGWTDGRTYATGAALLAVGAVVLCIGGRDHAGLGVLGSVLVGLGSGGLWLILWSTMTEHAAAARSALFVGA